MSIWLFRAGSHGEYENKFLNDKRVYLTWDDLNINLKSIKSKEDLYKILIDHYDIEKEKAAINWASQIWPIAHRSKKEIGLYCQVKLTELFTLARLLGNMSTMNL